MIYRRIAGVSAVFVVSLAFIAVGIAAAASPSSPSGKDNPHTPAALRPALSARLANVKSTGAECPTGLVCRVAPAAYRQNKSSPGDYGNYDLANRPTDGLAVRFIVIHDTEAAYQPTLALFQNPFAYASAHYVVRSADGLVTQTVPTTDVAWHAGNWWVNAHSVGIENEGYALAGTRWYTDRLYRSLAQLTRYLARRYGVPLDREHIIGHDQVPGQTSADQAGMHWDPGPYFDWARFMALVGAPIAPHAGVSTRPIVTIAPNFATNKQLVSGCEAGVCAPSHPQPANFVYLHTAPRAGSPLVSDPYLVAAGGEPRTTGTTYAWDWGDKAVTGQSFAVAGRSGNWTAIWYGGAKAWLYDPAGRGSVTIPGSGTPITPKAGRAWIAVYGRAYPSSTSTVALDRYRIPAGQVYVANDLVGADYYHATLFNAPHTYYLAKSAEKFYEISFNHRVAFVKASDVDTVR